MWAPVPEIEETPYRRHDDVVHNLSVEEDRSYTVDDYIVHNAQDFVRQFAIEKGSLVDEAALLDLTFLPLTL